MSGHSVWRVVVLSMLVLGTAGTATAQELAGSFDQLRVLVKPGDTVSVAEQAGRVTRGRITELSPSSLVLVTNGTRRELREADINTIRQRRDDSLANGAGWGLLVGGGLGLLAGLSVASEYEEGAGWALPFFGLIYGGIGTGVGVGIDALIRGERVIYAGRAAAPSTKITVSPMMSAARKGVAVSLGF